MAGTTSRPIPVASDGGQQIWPDELIPAHETLTVEVVVKRPGWSRG